MNEAASSVALAHVAARTVAPSTLVREYDVASPIVSSGVGPAREPRLAQRDLRGLEVAPVVREIEVVGLDLFDERRRAPASLKLFHQSVFGQTAASSKTGPMKRCGTSLSGSGGGSIVGAGAREPAAQERRQCVRACYSLDSATTGSRRAALRAGAKPNIDARRGRAAEGEQHRLGREHDVDVAERC